MCIKDASESTFGPDDISKEGTMQICIAKPTASRLALIHTGKSLCVVLNIVLETSWGTPGFKCKLPGVGCYHSSTDGEIGFHKITPVGAKVRGLITCRGAQRLGSVNSQIEQCTSSNFHAQIIIGITKLDYLQDVQTDRFQNQQVFRY